MGHTGGCRNGLLLQGVEGGEHRGCCPDCKESSLGGSLLAVLRLGWQHLPRWRCYQGHHQATGHRSGTRPQRSDTARQTPSYNPLQSLRP